MNTSRTNKLLKVSAVAVLNGMLFTACSGSGRVEVNGTGGGRADSIVRTELVQVNVETDYLARLGKLKSEFDSAPTEEKRAAVAANIIDTLEAEDRKDVASRTESALKVFSPGDYQRIARSLSESETPQKVLTLFRMHERHGVSIAFAQTLIDPLLNGNFIYLEQAKKSFGLGGVIELLSHATATQIREMSPPVAKAVLEKTIDLFDPKKIHEEPFNRWTRAYEQLVYLRRFARKLEKLVPMADLVAWLERVHRKFEADLRENSESSRYFVRELSDNSLDAAWLKFRVLGKVAALESGVQVESATTLRKLDEVLQARMRAHFSLTAEALKKNLSSYCKLLNDVGISGLTIQSNQVPNRFSELLVPGCHRVVRSADTEDKPIVVSMLQVLMPFDSVITAAGQSIEFRTHAFDGSFINLSSKDKHADLVQTATTPESYDAIAFPMVVGLKVSGRPEYENGIYFLIGHFPYKEAFNGPAVDVSVRAADGFPGGSLSIAYRDTERSFEPTFLSKGGLGQKGLSALPGGKQDVSVFTPRAIHSYLARYQTEHTEIFPYGFDAIPVRSPSVGYLNELIGASEHEENEPKLYVPEGYLKNLEVMQGNRLNEQGQKIVNLCKSLNLYDQYANGEPNLERCYKQHLARKFVNLIIDQLKHYQKDGQSMAVLPFLRLTEYMSPDTFTMLAANPGKPGEPGREGESGQIEFINGEVQ